MVIDDVISDLMQLKGISRETADTLLRNGGYNVYTCLDVNVQNSIDAIYTDLEAIPNTWGSDQQLQSGIVVMDPYDGRILGLSGGVGEKTGNFELNRATGTKRPPGSSIKPLSAYGPAIDLGLITPETTVMDSPNVVLNGIDWLPANDSRSYMGLVTIYTALQYSINTVAAQIVDILPQGPQTSYDYLVNHLGFTSLVPEHDIAYAPMSLGQFYNGCTVREMAQAYCSIVNDGIFTHSRTYTMLTDSEGNIVIDNTPRTIQAFEPNTAYTLTYLLQNAVEHGTGTEAALWSVPVAGKTGSSGQYMDRWFVGCTPYYVAAVWTGYDEQEAIQVSGWPGSPSPIPISAARIPVSSAIPTRRKTSSWMTSSPPIPTPAAPLSAEGTSSATTGPAAPPAAIYGTAIQVISGAAAAATTPSSAAGEITCLSGKSPCPGRETSLLPRTSAPVLSPAAGFTIIFC